MELKIKKAQNGFIISWKEEIEDNIFREVSEVIEGRESEQEEMRRLLEFVAGNFGFHYSKYGNDNINITFDKKGHKVE